MATKQVTSALPFTMASRQMTRNIFQIGPITLTANSQPLAPIPIPAMGFLRGITLDVTITGTGGTTPAFLADAPFNVLSQIEFRTSGGSDVITPITGYQQYLCAKYGALYSQAPYCDVRTGRQYSAVAPSAHFILPIWFEIDSETGLNSLPCLSSSKTYQLLLQLNSLAQVLSGSPTATVTISGTAYYWSQPPAQNASQVHQTTEPLALGSYSQWQLDTAALTPGDKKIKLNNVGNIIRTLIFTLRNASGQRIDANGWPAASEIYLDNIPMHYLPQTEWENMMVDWYGFDAATKDTVKALDTGVYVMPYHALCGGMAGDAANSRAQLLPTMNSSQLEIRGMSFGSAASTLEVLTNSIVPSSQGNSAAAIYSK